MKKFIVSRSRLLEVAQDFASSMQFGAIGDSVQVLFDFKQLTFYTNRDIEVDRSRNERVILAMNIDGESYSPEEILEKILEELEDIYEQLQIED